MTLANELLSLREEQKLLHEENQHHKITIETLSKTQKELQEKNEDLEVQLARALRMLYGSKSEKTIKKDDPGQQYLFEVPVEIEDEPKEKPEARKKKKKPGRKKISAHIETQELILAAPEDKKVDENGKPLALLGYKDSERLDYIPGKHIRLIIRREIWGYKDSREKIFTASPLPSIIPKGKLTDRFLLDIIFQKFFMGLPLYRQIQEHNSKGAGLSKSTLSDGVQKFGHFFEGVYQAIKTEVFKSSFVQADETPIKCQKLKEGKMKKAYFWVFRSEAACFFHFGKTRAQKELEKVFDFLESPPGRQKTYTLYKDNNFANILTDGYTAYDSFFKDNKNIVLMACWAHVRRKFFELQNSNEDAPKILKRINRLYRFEREFGKKAEAENWSQEKLFSEIHKVRQEKSRELIEKLETQIMNLSLSGKYTPGNLMTKALNYAMNLWDKLTVFLSDGQLPIDNNAAERAIKPVVIGRKNYLFVGSEDAGNSAAIAYTLIESCRQQNISPEKYLNLATQKLHQGTHPENLTPAKLKNQIQAVPKTN